jgi:hypothetical protein
MMMLLDEIPALERNSLAFSAEKVAVCVPNVLSVPSTLYVVAAPLNTPLKAWKAASEVVDAALDF